MSERVIYALQNTSPESTDFRLVEFHTSKSFEDFAAAVSFANALHASPPKGQVLVGLPMIEADSTGIDTAPIELHD